MSDSKTGPHSEESSGAYRPDAAAPAAPQAGAPERAAAPGSRRRIIAVGATALVLVGAAVGGFLLFGSDSGTKYKLTTPKTLAGDYERDGKGRKGDGKAFGDKKVPGMDSNAHVSAKYQGGATKKLQFGGAYGTVRNPGQAVDWVFEQAGKTLKSETGAKAEGDLEAFSPAGFDGDVLKCREFTIQEMSLAMCGWADASTVATVTSMHITDDAKKTHPVDLEKAAETAAKIRKETQVEAG